MVRMQKSKNTTVKGTAAEYRNETIPQNNMN